MTPLENLSPKNFLSICDVAMDILEELQLIVDNKFVIPAGISIAEFKIQPTNSEVVIPLFQNIIKPGFSILMPNNDPDSANNYCEIRMKAINYLQDNGYISILSLLNFIGDRSDKKINLSVNKKSFYKFYEELEELYQQKFVNSTQREQEQKDFQNESEKQQPSIKIDKLNGRPYTEVKNNKGYFKFHKQGENIEIGGEDTRKFRLLQCLCEPHFGVHKAVEGIFEAIRKSKDKDDSDLSSWNTQREIKKLKLIEYAKKELQKNKMLQGKIRYKFDDRKQEMWLELEG